MKKFLACLAIYLFGITACLAQSAPVKYFSTASTNSQLIWPGKSVLHALMPINTTGVLYYLKLYDTIAAPNCGTDIPKWTVPVPYGVGSTGAGVALPSTDGLIFINGLGICITGGIADNDSSNAAAGIVVNFGVGAN